MVQLEEGCTGPHQRDLRPPVASPKVLSQSLEHASSSDQESLRLHETSQFQWNRSLI